MAAIGTLGTDRRARRVRELPGGLHLELRRVDRARAGQFAERIESALHSHPAVRAAHVIGAVDQVVVAFEGEAGPADELVDAVASVEESFGVGDQPFARDAPPHPADDDLVTRRFVALGGAIVGLVVAVGRQVTLLPPPPFGGQVAAALAMAEHHPRVRAVVERLLGTEPAEVVLAVGDGISQGLAGSLVGPAVEVLHRQQRLEEARARRQLWWDHGAALPIAPAAPGDRGAPTRRPRPVPPGIVERYGDVGLMLASAGAAAVFVVTRSLPWTSAVIELALPKAANRGREGFATRLSTILAGDGVLVLDLYALRLLDRVDVLIADADLLCAGSPPHAAPAAGELLAEARSAGLTTVVVGRPEALGALPHVDEGFAEEAGLAEAVRRAQADGHVVAVIDRTGSAGLAAADVGLALSAPGDALPWTADAVALDGDLRHARLLVAACRAARQVSAVSALLAGAGAAGGLAAALTGPPWTARRRAADGVNAAAGVALANGIRVARRLRGRVGPLPPGTGVRGQGSELRSNDAVEPRAPVRTGRGPTHR